MSMAENVRMQSRVDADGGDERVVENKVEAIVMMNEASASYAISGAGP
jgi:hypothetical protein